MSPRSARPADASGVGCTAGTQRRSLAVATALLAGLALLPSSASAAFTYPPQRTVLLGQGDLTYAEGYATAALGDVNGDGLGDVAILKHRKNGFGIDDTAHILLGTRTGKLPGNLDALGTHGFQILSGEQINGVSPAGDFDGDGLDDILLKRNSGFVVVYGDRGPADVNTQVESSRITKLPLKVGTAYAAGDFNGDGADDLTANVEAVSAGTLGAANAVLLGGPRLAVLTPTDPRIFGFPGPRQCRTVWFQTKCTQTAYLLRPVGDYNGDGLTDVAVQLSYTATMIVFGRPGRGSFTPAAPSPAGSFVSIINDRPTAASETFTVMPVPGVPVLSNGDFDGDGRADPWVSAANNTSTTYVVGLFHSLGGTAPLRLTATPIARPANEPDLNSLDHRIGDFDGDGKVDWIGSDPDYIPPGEHPLPPASWASPARGAGMLFTSKAHAYDSPQVLSTTPDPPPPVDSGLVGPFSQWTNQGVAFAANDGSLQLTPATASQFGMMFWPTPIDPRNKTYEFDATLAGGSGAGIGMVMGFGKDGWFHVPVSTVLGSALGWGGTGQSGFAVALQTVNTARTDPHSAFVGLTDGRIPNAKPQAMRWLATADPGTDLRAAPVHVKVVTGAASISVSVNGRPLFDRAVTLPTSTYLQFSATTGTKNFQSHSVKNLTVRGN